LIEAIGLNAFNPSVTLKEIAKQIGDRDTSVRNAALNALTIAYQISGDFALKCIGKLNDKDQSMLDERIKRSVKSGGLKPSQSATQVISSNNNVAQQTIVSKSTSHTSIASLTQAVASANINGLNHDDDHPPVHQSLNTTKRVSTVNTATLTKVSS
jgi:hypothetical protein